MKINEFEKELTRKQIIEKKIEMKLDAFKLDVSEDLFNELKERNVSVSELSEKSGISKIWINKMLKGDINSTTIKRMARIGVILENYDEWFRNQKPEK